MIAESQLGAKLSRADRSFIDQMRRMSTSQTSYTWVLTDPDISIVCGQESLLRVMDQSKLRHIS